MSPPGPRVVMACDFHRHYCAMLSGALDRAGSEVTMITRDHDLEFGGVPGAATKFVRREAGPGVSLSLISGRVRDPAGWGQARAVRRSTRDAGPAIVHLQEAIANDLRLVYAARARRGRYAMTVHDPVRHPGDREHPIGTRLDQLLVRGAGLIFVHAEALREELIERRRPKAPIVVVPHASDPAEPAPLPQRPSVLFFGRISYYKGLDVLLDAMEDVWKAMPETTLTVAGAGEIEAHPTLEDERVTVRSGHIPEADVPALMNEAVCVALPYRQASQSGVGSRTKPYARPLVVTEVGGLPELVADGSGLVVPPEDPAGLAEAILKLLGDRALAERLGAAGAATAAAETSWDVVAELTLAAYEEHLSAS